LGIAALAITDHDTVAGVSEAQEAATEFGLALLSGVEVSTYFDRQELHILGLGIDIHHEALLQALATLQESRNNRAKTMMGLLHELDIPILDENVLALADGGSVGRMHIARELVTMGVTKKTQEGFDRFLKPGCPAYVSKATLPAAEAIALIHQAGGLAFLAHPGLSKNCRKALPQILELPFDGIEAYHTRHNPGRTEEFLQLAEARKLLVSGGSDCHGTIKGQAEMGKVRTPYAIYERICERLQQG
jgi:predicted metal-dependent phosphoesterase TrpH